MNVPFRLKDATLESVFVKEAEKLHMYELAGHRSVGGIRASLYNAITVEEATSLKKFMEDFHKKHQ